MKEKYPTLNRAVLDEIKETGGNLSKVARAMGLDYHALKARTSNPSGPKGSYGGQRPDDIRELAKPSLMMFAIAAKRAGGEWPLEFKQAIERGRRLYDAGTHEMVQGTRDGWVVLYLIPRLVHTKPRRYFANMEIFS